jgi:hypothetical protein
MPFISMLISAHPSLLELLADYDVLFALFA